MVMFLTPLSWLKEKVVDLLKEIKYFYQRGKRGYSDRDLWSLDCYLSSWLPDALYDLSMRVHGHPADIKTYDEWTQILRKMARGFQEMHQDKSEGRICKSCWKQHATTLKLFAKHFHDLWD